jgi:TRAP-type uncharacterized transport system substrate-binding protein
MGSRVLETWSVVEWPVLIVGLGALLIGAVLPWLTDGWGTDRRVRGGLLLGGVLVCGVALWPAVQSPRAQESGVPQGQFSYPECIAKLNAATNPSSKPSANQPIPDGKIGLVSGISTGLYYKLADDLVKLAGPHQLTLVNRETLGSEDNFRKLVSTENAGIGFVQSDLLDWMRHSTNGEERKQAELLRLVLPLYPEEIHVLARRQLLNLADLAGRHVLTPAGSQGSRYTAQNLLRTAQVQPASLDGSQPLVEAMCSVLLGRADAVVFVQGKPVQSLVNLQELRHGAAGLLDGVHLMPLDMPPNVVGYEVARIDHSDYPWLQAPVQTLSVQAMLMAVDFSLRRTPYEKLRCRQIKQLADLVKAKLPTLRPPDYQQKWLEVDPRHTVRGWKPVECPA